MPFVGRKRQKAHKNAIDAAKAAGVKQIIYTSLVNADDERQILVLKRKTTFIQKIIYKRVKGRLRLSVYEKFTVCGEMVITLLWQNVKWGTPLTNSQGDGLMAYISRKDCAKAVAYALHRSGEFTRKVGTLTDRS